MDEIHVLDKYHGWSSGLMDTPLLSFHMRGLSVHQKPLFGAAVLPMIQILYSAAII